ncbi:S-layer homology domain-containing protein [Proteiniborus ethanoligenes]|uniref:S-layer homology domain-containing protein n=1 Tax=Proteiniborus ethanoligenes TaxID=415015 RepID=A0A1H3LYQ0_9FIRM|nr:S-layer homology domain-containing protein [Proteiniborus ethanoligenes]SDY69667.1 S-layer homology domain-containing protein [Proteiniborus ethanoligenes]
MKKVLSLVLVLTLVLGSFSFAFAAPSDVVGTDYEDAVERLSQLKVLTGYPDGTFKPNNTITRAEFAAAVVRVKGLESAALAAQGSTVFTDVPAGNWAAGYVNIASKLGIVKGMGDGTFAPNSPVTYEQAVTMVMRALGYETAAESRGGYPYGYLIVANENDLLDQVKGVQGLPAVRGLVAQLLDNALEIEMMVQVGTGITGQPVWVKSGTQGTTAVTLLDELGFKNVEGMVTIVNTTKSSIKVGDTTLTAPAGFDFNFYEGLTVKAWYASGKIVALSQQNEAKYDAVIYSSSDGKLKLVTENVKYDVATGANLKLNGTTEVKANFDDVDYAKIVLDEDGNIAWAKGYTFDGNIVVKDVKDDVVYSYNKDELDVNKYTLIRDGKTVKAEELDDMDILFYNASQKFAVVINIEESGEIERVYSDGFKFDGEVYDLSAKYLDGSKLAGLTATALDAMKKEGTVTVYFDYNGNPVLVVGDTGAVTTNSSYALLASPLARYEGRGSAVYYTFDVLNSEGKIVKYDLTKAFIEDSAKFVGFGTNDGSISNPTIGTKHDVVIVTLNANGAVTKVEKLRQTNISTAFKTTATYAEGLRLQSDATVFWTNNESAVADYTVMTWAKADAEFSQVQGGKLYEVDGRVVAMFIDATNADASDATVKGLITDVKNLRVGGKQEITMQINGKEEVYLTSLTFEKATVVGTVYDVKVGNKSGEIVAGTMATKVSGKIDTNGISLTDRTIKIGGVTYELVSDAVIYVGNPTDGYAKKALRDLSDKVGTEDTVTLYFDGTSGRFIKYVVK